jgi:hypothetical protein
MKVALFALPALLLAAPLLPCSIAVEPHEIDPAERAVDVTPPAAPAGEVDRIVRGKGAVRAPDGSIQGTSCDDIGMITFRIVTPAADDRTPPERLGYRITLAEGTLPEGLELPSTAFRQPMLHWIDGATDDQEPIDFSVRIVAVDRAGNESAPSAPIRIRDPRERIAKE